MPTTCNLVTLKVAEQYNQFPTNIGTLRTFFSSSFFAPNTNAHAYETCTSSHFMQQSEQTHLETFTFEPKQYAGNKEKE